MSARIRNVLFLCTANSARSILAEAILKRLGEGKYRAFSAGSHPRGRVNPDALDCLKRHGDDVAGLSSKRWDVFSGPDAPRMDLVVTVCDAAAGEACPIWPGHPLTVHWGIPDPAGADGAEGGETAFNLAYDRLERRIAAFLALGDNAFKADDARAQLAAIGRIDD
ncbi:arsenate reductase ArsC [Rhizobiales bacterium]|uniref:arsenate reductase ArsC n=1 Tax=Hongsoonwoonella zoysiae TaxID=2821844 RepID=UPI0015617344|nr:arsenate reductase ArsC [Hongsoonwoonella zoysiae]NRG17430.1 arsenate reductase ArsC [Hongsoonwoonella zoysiae]